MTAATERLERYLEDELGECRSEDVEARLDELSTLEAALGTEQAAAELEVLGALASETRYTVLRVLVAAEEELCVCELSAVVDVTDSGLSHALSELAGAGLVESRKDGRWKRYRATRRAVAIVTVLEGAVSVGQDAATEEATAEDATTEGADSGDEASEERGAAEGTAEGQR